MAINRRFYNIAREKVQRRFQDPVILRYGEDENSMEDSNWLLKGLCFLAEQGYFRETPAITIEPFGWDSPRHQLGQNRLLAAVQKLLRAFQNHSSFRFIR